jgi:spore germination protein GerM
MSQSQKNRRRSQGLVVAGASIATIAAVAGLAWWGVSSLSGIDQDRSLPISDSEPAPGNPTNPNKKDEQPKPPQQQTLQLYWLQATEQDFKLVASNMQVAATVETEQALEQALKQLLEGNGDGPETSTIPEGTQLRSVSVRSDGIHVNLSEEFRLGGGSTSMVGRLGQVLYTATSHDSQARVWLEVEGEPLQYLGGEGVAVKQPMTRQYFQRNFSL